MQTVNSNINKDQKDDIQETVSKDAGKDQKSASKSRKPTEGFSSLETPWSVNLKVGSFQEINP